MTPDPRLERRAMAWIRKTKYKGVLAARGQHVAKPDFSECATSVECEIVQLGGDVETWRRLSSIEPDEQTGADRALDAALVSLGAKPAPRIEFLEGREPAVEPVVTATLKSLGLNPAFARCDTESEALAAKRALDEKA